MKNFYRTSTSAESGANRNPQSSRAGMSRTTLNNPRTCSKTTFAHYRRYLDCIRNCVGTSRVITTIITKFLPLSCLGSKKKQAYGDFVGYMSTNCNPISIRKIMFTMKLIPKSMSNFVSRKHTCSTAKWNREPKQRMLFGGLRHIHRWLTEVQWCRTPCPRLEPQTQVRV